MHMAKLANSAKFLALGCVFWGLTAFPATADGETYSRTLQQDVFAGEVHSLELDLGTGDLTIEGTKGRNVEVTVTLTCGRESEAKCRRRADRLSIKPRRKKGLLLIRLKGASRGKAGGISADMHIKVPRRLALEVDMLEGNVTISKMRSHIEVDAVAGDVDLQGRKQDLAEVKAAVGVGKVDLWLDEGRIEGSGFPRSVNWHGDGSAEWEVDLGTGDISVRLE